MDKIINKSINLGGQKSEIAKNNDVLGALFSLPMNIDDKKFNEITINPDVIRIIDGNKFKKPMEKIKINIEELFNNLHKKDIEKDIEQNTNKNDKLTELNPKKFPNLLKLDLKIKKTNMPHLLKNKDQSKDKIFKINNDNLIDGNLEKKVKSTFNNQKIKNLKTNVNPRDILKNVFDKIDNLKDDINSEKFENKIIFYDSEVRYKQLKINNEKSNVGNNHDQLNKIDNLNFRNNSNNNPNQFNNEKNMNFVLDQLMEELDMSKTGWTEKLILRIEKGLKEEEQQIELSLKPKELGNLKINLKLKENTAQIVMKVENSTSILALQTNESYLVKSLSEQGFDLEKLSFENSFMNSNKENNNSSKKEDKNYSNQESSNTFDEEENNKDDNLNYLININA